MNKFWKITTTINQVETNFKSQKNKKRNMLRIIFIWTSYFITNTFWQAKFLNVIHFTFWWCSITTKKNWLFHEIVVYIYY